MKKLIHLGIGLVLATAVTSTIAAEYPTRPITFMTMTQPGAQIDGDVQSQKKYGYELRNGVEASESHGHQGNQTAHPGGYSRLTCLGESCQKSRRQPILGQRLQDSRPTQNTAKS